LSSLKPPVSIEHSFGQLHIHGAVIATGFENIHASGGLSGAGLFLKVATAAPSRAALSWNRIETKRRLLRSRRLEERGLTGRRARRHPRGHGGAVRQFELSAQEGRADISVELIPSGIYARDREEGVAAILAAPWAHSARMQVRAHSARNYRMKWRRYPIRRLPPGANGSSKHCRG